MISLNDALRDGWGDEFFFGASGCADTDCMGGNDATSSTTASQSAPRLGRPCRTLPKAEARTSEPSLSPAGDDRREGLALSQPQDAPEVRGSASAANESWTYDEIVAREA